MISTVRFPPSYGSNSNSLSFSHKIQLGFSFLPNTSSSSSSSLAVNFRNLRFPVVYVQKSRNFGLTSQRKRRKPGGAPVLEMDSDSDSDEDGDDVDDEEPEMDDDDDDGVTVPFGKMKKWLQKKPRGFGVGKSYDTPIEDQLLEEIEKTAKLRNDAVKTTSQQNNTKAVEAVPAGFGVRVTNIPKKKNVHRDLGAAFKQVPGLVSINPAVTGNKKTKDPICKGFAFVHFKSEKDATRFVEMYSSQSIAFGKIQKQIKCEVVKSEPDSGEDKSKAPRITTPRLSAIKPVTLKAPQSPKPATDKYTAPASKPSTDNYTDPQLIVSALGDEEVDSELVDSSLDTLEEILSDEYEGSDLQLLGLEVEDLMENPQLTVATFGDEQVDSDLDEFDEYEGPDVQLVGPELEDFTENLATSTVSHLHEADSDAIELRTESESLAESSSSKQLLAKSEKAKASQKKAVKGKVQGSPKKNKVTILNGGDSDNIELRTESESLAESFSSDQLFAKSEVEKAPRQKKAVKAEVEGSPKKKVAAKTPKLAIGGSSKRLKVKEKAVLGEVFSKYGINPGLASKEDS